MRIGMNTAQIGRLADGHAVRQAAMAAEAAGYSSLWAFDRLLAPVAPQEGQTFVAGVATPAQVRGSLDPLAVLAASAAVTEHIRLGTSVLVAPWYRPALLARSLTAIDVLSDGRLTVGLGQGWSPEEFAAVGVERRHRARSMEQTLDVLEAFWADGPLSYQGDGVRIAPSYNEVRPVQWPRPPILLAASSPAGLDRVARRADGWNPVGVPLPALPALWGQLRDLAAGYGRNPDDIDLVVRVGIRLTDRPIEGRRPDYAGNVEQVAADLAATEALGADEVILGLYGDPDLDQTLEVYEAVLSASTLAPTAMAA